MKEQSQQQLQVYNQYQPQQVLYSTTYQQKYQIKDRKSLIQKNSSSFGQSIAHFYSKIEFPNFFQEEYSKRYLLLITTILSVYGIYYFIYLLNTKIVLPPTPKIDVKMPQPKSINIQESFNSTQMAARIQYIEDGNPKINEKVQIQIVDFIQSDSSALPNCDYKDRYKRRHTLEFIRLEEVCKVILSKETITTDKNGLAVINSLQILRGPIGQYGFQFSLQNVTTDIQYSNLITTVDQLYVLTNIQEEINIGTSFQLNVSVYNMENKAIKGKFVIAYSWPNKKIDSQASDYEIDGLKFAYFKGAVSNQSDINGTARFQNLTIIGCTSSIIYIHLICDGASDITIRNNEYFFDLFNLPYYQIPLRIKTTVKKIKILNETTLTVMENTIFPSITIGIYDINKNPLKDKMVIFIISGDQFTNYQYNYKLKRFRNEIFKELLYPIEGNYNDPSEQLTGGQYFQYELTNDQGQITFRKLKLTAHGESNIFYYLTPICDGVVSDDKLKVYVNSSISRLNILKVSTTFLNLQISDISDFWILLEIKDKENKGIEGKWPQQIKCFDSISKDLLNETQLSLTIDYVYNSRYFYIQIFQNKQTVSSEQGLTTIYFKFNCMRNDTTNFFIELFVDQIAINSSIIIFSRTDKKSQLGLIMIENSENTIRIPCNEQNQNNQLIIMVYDDNCLPLSNVIINITNGIINVNDNRLPNSIQNNFTSNSMETDQNGVAMLKISELKEFLLLQTNYILISGKQKIQKDDQSRLLQDLFEEFSESYLDQFEEQIDENYTEEFDDLNNDKIYDNDEYQGQFENMDIQDESSQDLESKLIFNFIFLLDAYSQSQLIRVFIETCITNLTSETTKSSNSWENIHTIKLNFAQKLTEYPKLPSIKLIEFPSYLYSVYLDPQFKSNLNSLNQIVEDCTNLTVLLIILSDNEITYNLSFSIQKYCFGSYTYYFESQGLQTEPFSIATPTPTGQIIIIEQPQSNYDLASNKINSTIYSGNFLDFIIVKYESDDIYDTLSEYTIVAIISEDLDSNMESVLFDISDYSSYPSLPFGRQRTSKTDSYGYAVFNQLTILNSVGINCIRLKFILFDQNLKNQENILESNSTNLFCFESSVILDFAHQKYSKSISVSTEFNIPISISISFPNRPNFISTSSKGYYMSLILLDELNDKQIPEKIQFQMTQNNLKGFICFFFFNGTTSLNDQCTIRIQKEKNNFAIFQDYKKLKWVGEPDYTSIKLKVRILLSSTLNFQFKSSKQLYSMDFKELKDYLTLINRKLFYSNANDELYLIKNQKSLSQQIIKQQKGPLSQINNVADYLTHIYNGELDEKSNQQSIIQGQLELLNSFRDILYTLCNQIQMTVTTETIKINSSPHQLIFLTQPPEYIKIYTKFQIKMLLLSESQTPIKNKQVKIEILPIDQSTNSNIELLNYFSKSQSGNLVSVINILNQQSQGKLYQLNNQFTNEFGFVVFDLFINSGKSGLYALKAQCENLYSEMSNRLYLENPLKTVKIVNKDNKFKALVEKNQQYPVKLIEKLELETNYPCSENQVNISFLLIQTGEDKEFQDFNQLSTVDKLSTIFKQILSQGKSNIQKKSYDNLQFELKIQGKKIIIQKLSVQLNEIGQYILTVSVNGIFSESIQIIISYDERFGRLNLSQIVFMIFLFILQLLSVFITHKDYNAILSFMSSLFSISILILSGVLLPNFLIQNTVLIICEFFFIVSMIYYYLVRRKLQDLQIKKSILYSFNKLRKYRNFQKTSEFKEFFSLYSNPIINFFFPVRILILFVGSFVFQILISLALYQLTSNAISIVNEINEKMTGSFLSYLQKGQSNLFKLGINKS